MAKILDIITEPNPILRRKSEEIELSQLQQPDMKAYLDDLVETMWRADGVGIASPQVGRNIRVVVITNDGEAMVLVNPKIIWKSLFTESLEEGCLSVPGFYGSVRRAKKVRCLAYDRDGIKIDIKANGLTARIIQHEIDHIDGILFIDRAKKVIPLEAEAAL